MPDNTVSENKTDDNIIIEVKNLTKRFPKGTVALNGVSLAIERGKFNAVMGPSGSGKSTLMNIIGLLDEPTEGELYIGGRKIEKLGDKEASKLRMSTIGFVFQDFCLNDYLSALDNIILPMKINPKFSEAERIERAEQLLGLLGITECRDKLPKEMSGGEQQRTAIARALANEPEIILADEPTGNLDEENEKNIFDCLKQISDEGRTVVAISHNDMIKEYADRVIYIKKGSITEDA